MKHLSYLFSLSRISEALSVFSDKEKDFFQGLKDWLMEENLLFPQKLSPNDLFHYEYYVYVRGLSKGIFFINCPINSSLKYSLLSFTTK